MDTPKYRSSIAKKIAEAERIVKILEAVSNEIGATYSPAIVLNGLGELKQHFPYPFNTQFIYSGNKCIGWVSLGGDFIDEEIGERYEAVQNASRALYERHCHGELADPDAAFLTIRHLSNNWWGRGSDDSHPDNFANELMRRFPA